MRRISSPILADYDIELVDVSLDALVASTATIGYLELVHAKGTTIVIENLTLPIGAADDAVNTYAAQHVSIVTTTRDRDASFELARLINQFLSLSDSVAGTVLHIAQFDLPPYPTIHDLSWTISGKAQTLSLTVGSIDMSVATHRSGDDTYDVSFSLPNQPGSDDTVNSITGKLQQTADGISIAGQSMLELSNWQALATFAELLPDAVEIRSGSGELQFEVEIPLDESRVPTVLASLTPSSPWQIAYADEFGDSTDVLVTSERPIKLLASFPEIDWSLQQTGLSLLVTNEEWNELPLSISDLACRSGPACSMGVNIVWLDAKLPVGRAAKVVLSSVLDIGFPAEGVRVDVQPNASLDLSGLTTPDHSIDHVGASLISVATMQYTDDGWRFSADSIDARIESLALDTDITMSSPLYLENIQANMVDRITSASSRIFVPSLHLTVNNRNIAAPGVKGEVSLVDSEIDFDLLTIGLLKDGTINGKHNLDSGIGNVDILDTTLTFDRAPLSSRVAPWENDLDVSAGNLAVNLHAKWTPTKSHTRFEVRSSVQVDAVAGFYADIAFVGFSTDVKVNYNGTEIAVAPTSIRIDLVDMGVPIEHITADVDIDALAIDVDNLQMSAFSGTISAAPFSYRTGGDINNVVLTAKGIELAELLNIEEFAAVTVTGTIGGVLPIAFAEDGISIKAGKLSGEAPGGIIRYLSGDDPDENDLSGLGLATAALSNFEYESLTADVSYSKAGDLKLQMQIKGRNPELEDGRPVVLNLGVENNVPQMLKSLQAARAVEEILEKRLAE